MMKKYILGGLLSLLMINAMAQNNNLIIGTYTNNCESKGIYVYDFNSATADFRLKGNTDKVENPSFLAVSGDRKLVYSVNESGAASGVSTFKFDASKGSLEFLSRVDSKGADPCYILNDDKNVMVANYSGGNIAVFKKNPDGTLTQAKQVIQHKGKSKSAKRQESAHVHMVQFTPDKKFVLANDLGTDKIYIYQYNPESADKILQIRDSVAVKRGSGPRHLIFGPNGKTAYLLHELDGSLTAYNYDNGKLTLIQEAQIVFKTFRGEIGAADIHITPDGRFLYATDRGTANDITCFQILPDGRLNFRFNASVLGSGPRNFAIDPTGSFLLVANQNTNNIVIFSINKATGKLTDTGKRIEVCSPVCLVFS